MATVRRHIFQPALEKTTRSVDSISGGNHPAKPCLSPLVGAFSSSFFASSNEEARAGGETPRCTCVTARRHARTLDFSARNDRRVHFSRVILCNPENRVEPIARRITIRSSGLRARSTNRRVLRARLENKEGGKEKRGHGERHRNRRNGKITEEHCSSTVRHHTGTAAHRDG